MSAETIECRFRVALRVGRGVFHLYGLDREQTGAVLDSFPIVARKDNATFGSFRTRDEILRFYDAMSGAVAV